MSNGRIPAFTIISLTLSLFSILPYLVVTGV